MNNTNKMNIIMDSKHGNERFARVSVAAFCTPLNPTIEEISDIKTAVSEAVSNCMIHAYENDKGKIEIGCSIEDREITIQIKDYGKGIENIEKAMQPLYTTRPMEEHSGMGFTFMEAFMDEIKIESKLEKGTLVKMKKIIRG